MAAPTTKKRGPRKGSMSAEHKKALTEGRTEARAVKAYLDALEESKPKRGRKMDPKAVAAKLESVNKDLATAGGARKLELIVTRMELESRLKVDDSGVDISELRKGFIKH